MLSGFSVASSSKAAIGRRSLPPALSQPSRSHEALVVRRIPPLSFVHREGERGIRCSALSESGGIPPTPKASRLGLQTYNASPRQTASGCQRDLVTMAVQVHHHTGEQGATLMEFAEIKV